MFFYTFRPAARQNIFTLVTLHTYDFCATAYKSKQLFVQAKQGKTKEEKTICVWPSIEMWRIFIYKTCATAITTRLYSLWRQLVWRNFSLSLGRSTAISLTFRWHCTTYCFLPRMQNSSHAKFHPYTNWPRFIINGDECHVELIAWASCLSK